MNISLNSYIGISLDSAISLETLIQNNSWLHTPSNVNVLIDDTLVDVDDKIYVHLSTDFTNFDRITAISQGITPYEAVKSAMNNLNIQLNKMNRPTLLKLAA